MPRKALDPAEVSKLKAAKAKRKTLADYKKENAELAVALSTEKEVSAENQRNVDRQLRKVKSLQKKADTLAKHNAELHEQNGTPLDSVESLTIHELLDAAACHLKANSFHMRGVSSSRILSLVRSARKTLLQATKK
jgi:hypothetical protein